VTYEGRPLYLYSLEKFTVVPEVPGVGGVLGALSVLLTTGTAGNGNGLRDPGGGTFSVIPVA